MHRQWLLGAALLALGCGDDESKRGEPCLSDADCGPLFCVADPDLAPQDMAALPTVCHGTADGAVQGESCAAPEDCARGICLLTGSCATPCEADLDCREFDRCRPVFAATALSALQRLNACVALATPPEDVSFEVQIRENALTGGDDRIEFISDGAPTLVVLEHLDETWPDTSMCRPPSCVTKLRDDAKTVLFDVEAIGPDESAPLSPVASNDHIFTPALLLPYEPALTPTADAYEIFINGEAPGDLRVTAFHRNDAPEDDIPLRLDLNLFYAASGEWRVTEERGPELLADALDRVDEILDQANIAIGRVAQHEIPDSLVESGVMYPQGAPMMGLATIAVRFGVHVELPRLFQLSAGVPGGGVNLFFVDAIGSQNSLGPDSRPITINHAAISGGIPGPLTMHGTGSSGIVVAVGDGALDADKLGRTLAHELSHFLGLFHTSERFGSVLDPLPDTPECRPDADINGDGLSAAECDGLGADNLMFFSAGGGTLLTENQINVLRSAIVLQ